MRHALKLLISCCLIAFSLAPAPSAAQQSPRTETVVVQLSGRTPAGTSVIGTIVARRTCANVVTTAVSFNGMVNGLPARFSAQVIERWLGPGREDVEVISTDLRGIVNGLSPIRTYRLSQSSPNLIFLDGVPVAIDGLLQEPCSGRLTYIVTNAGQLNLPITSLPNTSR
jgi:hypothetical protein